MKGDHPWEVKAVEVEEGEEDWMVEEVEEAAEGVAYSWRSDWRDFDPANY